MEDYVRYRLGEVRFHPGSNTWTVVGEKVLSRHRMRMRVQRILKAGGMVEPHVEVRTRARAILRSMAKDCRAGMSGAAS